MRGQTCLGSGLWKCRSGSTSGHRPAAHLAVPAAAAESRGAGEERGREEETVPRVHEEEREGSEGGRQLLHRGRAGGAGGGRRGQEGQRAHPLREEREAGPGPQRRVRAVRDAARHCRRHSVADGQQERCRQGR